MSGGSKIFVGNIPYGVTDEEIKNILGRAGNVLNFRAMTDKETGKPKGYGFAEFSDADQANSAVRNLNDFELQGRKLRVDYANEKDRPDPHASNNVGQQQGGIQQQTMPADGQAVPNRLPPLPPGRDLETGLSAADSISKTLTTLPPSQLLDILVQMQNLVLNDPVQATQLLDKSPQLSFAIFQALLNLNLIDSSQLSSVIQQATTAPPPVQPPQQTYQPPVPPQPPVPQPYQQQMPTPQYPPQYAPPQYQTSTPIQQYQAPPPPQPVVQPQAPDRNALIQQVLSMTQAQIDSMAPNDRQQIMALRAQLAQQFAPR